MSTLIKTYHTEANGLRGFFDMCLQKNEKKRNFQKMKIRLVDIHLKNKCTKFQLNMINFKLSRPVKRFYSDMCL